MLTPLSRGFLIPIIRTATRLNLPKSSLRPRILESKMPLVTISQSLDDTFKKHGVIPDVVKPFSSEVLLNISYGQDLPVTLGNELRPSETQSAPRIQVIPNASGKDAQGEFSETDNFIFVMTDPDAPSRNDPSCSEYAHWLVTDVPIVKKLDAATDEYRSEFELDLKAGKTLVPYMGPGPPPKTGDHRYVFLLYKQASGNKEFSAPSDRPNWGTGTPLSGVSDWIKSNTSGLRLLGVNFFLAQNADK